MSTINTILEGENNSCCRTCTGDPCASFVINSVQTINGKDVINFSMIGSLSGKKTCDKPLKDDMELSLNSFISAQLSSAFGTYINNLSTIGNFYIEAGQIYKLCATFKIKSCSDNGIISHTIEYFTTTQTS
jgi:hypothetical protein